MTLLHHRALLLVFLVSLEISYTSADATIEVYKIGNNGEPKDVYPLPECAGDCDDDEDVRILMYIYCFSFDFMTN